MKFTAQRDEFSSMQTKSPKAQNVNLRLSWDGVTMNLFNEKVKRKTT